MEYGYVGLRIDVAVMMRDVAMAITVIDVGR
jgi:hypothetical protein